MSHARRTGTLLGVSRCMKQRTHIVLFLAGAILAAGCRHTAEGVKDDTKNAVQKTGQGMEKAGKKVENAGRK
jgi:predicted small secreted protein